MGEIEDTSITLNLAKFNLQFDQEYFWSVFDKTLLDSKKDSISFRLLSPKQKDEIFLQIENLKKDFLIEDSPLNYYLIASYLKSKEVNEYAIKYMEKCIQLLPESEFYWAEYIQFLLDLGLSREALIEWNKSPFNKEIIKDEG